jgi:hypothetical protein
MAGERFQSLQEFWPYYLREHSDQTSRRLHFLGTSGFFAAATASLAMNPVGFGAALAGMAAIGKRALKIERNKRSLPHVLGMIALPTAVSPVLFPAGVVFAYGCAWIGHFKFENNRPATFQYPVMSLASDFKMWWQMAQGKLWSGEDPVGELGIDEGGAGAPASSQPADAAA